MQGDNSAAPPLPYHCHWKGGATGWHNVVEAIQSLECNHETASLDGTVEIAELLLIQQRRQIMSFCTIRVISQKFRVSSYELLMSCKWEKLEVGGVFAEYEFRRQRQQSPNFLLAILMSGATITAFCRFHVSSVVNHHNRSYAISAFLNLFSFFCMDHWLAHHHLAFSSSISRCSCYL